MSADPTENDAQGPGNELEPVDSEVTPVGGTSKKLLELSEGGDQNTRAYRAPRELLELARRQRALGFRHSQSPEARPSAAPPVPFESVPPAPAAGALPAGQRRNGPPAAASTPANSSQSLSNSSQRSASQRSSNPKALEPKAASPRALEPKASQERSTPGSSADKESGDVASSQKRRVRPVSLSPSDFSEGEAAPPRPIAESQGPRDRPTCRPGRSSEENVESSAPSISYQPASSRSADSVEALEKKAGSHPGVAGDAAPPVARSRPAHAISSEPSSPSPARPASSLVELARAASDRSAAPSVPAPSARIPANDLDTSVPSSLSTGMTTARNRAYAWAIVFALFILLGFLLARWHVLDLVLPPAR